MYRPRHIPLLLLLALALVVIPLAGCRADPLAIKVFGTPFTRDQLRALPQTRATFGGRTASGVSLQALLEAAGAETETVALVARDGYAASVPVDQLDERAVLSYGDGNTLDVVIPSLPASTWVRDVVEIAASETAGNGQAPVAGIGTGQVLVPSAAAAATAPVPGRTPLPLLGGSLTLEDGAGRAYVLAALPGRLVVAGPDAHMALHLLAMFPETPARLVGAETRGGTADPFLAAVNPAYAALTVLPEASGAETIAALAPDMVIFKTSVPGSAAGREARALQAALEAAGIATFYLDLETMLAFERDVANLGALLGNADRAEQIIAAYRGWLDEVDARVNDGTLARPDVLVLRWRDDATGGPLLEVPGAAGMQAAQVVRVCGQPAWVDHDDLMDTWTPVTVAGIAVWDPDIIVVVVPPPHDRAAVIEALRSDAAWAALRAVRNGRLYAYPRDLYGWGDANPRWILGVQWLATQVHPALFADLDLDATVWAWHAAMYGMADDTIDRAILPHVETDMP